MPCLTSEEATAAACAKLHGWPSAAGQYEQAGTPEGSRTGYWLNDLCLDTETGKEYAFNGTPGENTGWVALN